MGKTSWQVKQRYNTKTYTKISVDTPKELAAAFKEKCKRLEISQAHVIKEAIKDFVEKTE